MKKTFYTELAYALGLVFIALGAALMEKANFGVSMIVAPAYLIYLKMSATYSFSGSTYAGLWMVSSCCSLSSGMNRGQNTLV